MKTKFLLIFVAVFSLTTTAQKWTNYNTIACCIALDVQGNKWFDTDKGVSRFDGANWTRSIFVIKCNTKRNI
jgi:hypothetical protein